MLSAPGDVTMLPPHAQLLCLEQPLARPRESVLADAPARVRWRPVGIPPLTCHAVWRAYDAEGQALSASLRRWSASAVACRAGTQAPSVRSVIRSATQTGCGS